MAGPKPFGSIQTEFGIHHRLASSENLNFIKVNLHFHATRSHGGKFG